MEPPLSVPVLIARKRDGGELDPAEIDFLLDGYLTGAIPDYQMSALLMAICFRGLSAPELERWTARIVDSGERWDWSSIPGPKVDKHSTGGVGDKVSLVLAPVLSSLGLRLPMVAGRGLGHTGGTLDKIEAIPGFRTGLSRGEVERLLREVGYAIVGQTAAFAPLDRDLYALRDVTATVRSKPLIAASIVGKKVAEGLDALVLDVKTGSGAFLPDSGEAEDLARLMIALAARFGLRAEALLTDMDQPLGLAVGNALELREALDILRGEGPPDVRELTLALAARLLVMVEGGSEGSARARAESALREGFALERFRRSVGAQGGDPRIVDEPDRLPRAPATSEARAQAGGFVRSIDTRGVGRLAVMLGAGRATKSDVIDPAVGLVLDRKPGEQVAPNERLATIHAATPAAAQSAAGRLAKLYEIGPEPPVPRPLVGGPLLSRGADP